MHINIKTQLPVDVKEIELALVRKFNEASAMILSDRPGGSIDDLEELMKALLAEIQQKKALLTKAVPEQSIVLYFFCSSPEALDNINIAFQNGVLSQCIEKIVIRHVISTSSMARSTPPRGFISPSSINSDRSVVAHPGRASGRPIATVHFTVKDDDYKRCLGNFSQGK